MNARSDEPMPGGAPPSVGRDHGDAEIDKLIEELQQTNELLAKLVAPRPLSR
ncbi:MAG TPA: hypothetical protein VGS19_13340 [Streptosporangiaceae bacterium]|nr:hypothetical protein [Streptosporangiaceae bacterium]